MDATVLKVFVSFTHFTFIIYPVLSILINDFFSIYTKLVSIFYTYLQRNNVHWQGTYNRYFKNQNQNEKLFIK